jgi:hypothetical protein
VQPASLIRWELGSVSNHASVIVQQDSLVLRATEYETYAAFGQQSSASAKIESIVFAGRVPCVQ